MKEIPAQQITAQSKWMTKTVHPFVRQFLCRFERYAVPAIKSKKTSADYDLYNIELLFSAN